MEPPPPPPPPHGANPPGGRSGGLPDGKYDIFVIPPNSSGSGFLYLPSLQTQRNSFLAGCACTTFAFAVWNIMVPMARNWLFDTMNGGGSGVIVIMLVVGVLAWAVGKTQAESSQEKGGSGGASGGTSNFAGGTGFNPNTNPPPPNNSAPPPPKSSWQRPQSTPTSGQKSNWEKAREETRKREEEKKKADEAKRKAEELEKRKQELEKERQKQREKDTRERLERERKERKEKEDKQAAEKGKPSPTKRPPMPSARTEDDDDAYSFRPYDRPKHKANSGASVYSESSYAPSQSTARTTPPPSFSGPYSTKDPDKIMIKGVYSFNNAFMRTPIAQLVSGHRPVTDGLILRMSSEGLFIDDDRRNEAQREWDVKVWTMKLVESCEIAGVQILRASIRDLEGKKYVFVIPHSEGWKVAIGLQRLRRSNLVKSLGVAGLPQNEAKALLENLGFI